MTYPKWSRFDALSPAARAIWAKSGDSHGHSLLAHMLDVAAAAEAILSLEPPSTLEWAVKHFGLPRDTAWRWLAAIIGLHDFGKAIPGFQAKWNEGMLIDRAAGLDFSDSSLRADDHACATAALLSQVLHGVGGMSVSWVKHVVQAISAHHGYHYLATQHQAGKPLGEGPGWDVVRQDIFQTYWRVLSPQGSPSVRQLSLPAVNWMAGLTSTADWIASNVEWFPLGERHPSLVGHFRHARRLGRRALRDIGWVPSPPLLSEQDTTANLLTRVLARPVPPRPLQLVGDELLTGAGGPTFVLVEAPMGEGKTEFAFLAHLRLQARNGHRGLYVALPTQATSNAMFDRTNTFLDAFVKSRTDIQLVHGGASLNDRVRHLKGIDASSKESLSTSSWFSRRRRPMLSPYGVGTVDQALFAVLNVKHHFVRVWGLANRVVVIDEVHAYDQYTSGLVVTLLRWLKALGCSVVLMSATLARRDRLKLMEAWDISPAQVPELAYPRVLVADEKEVRGANFTARPLAPIHVHAISEDMDALVDKARQLVAAGGCGCVVLNTVTRAQQLYQVLRDSVDEEVDLLLFHARFPAEDRAALEREVLNRFGAAGTRPKRALLIATQVAEQSLDIDFDFMLSDLAPVDLLLQRAGRLHRHARPRPAAHAKACLYVAGLQGDQLPDLKGTAWEYVYHPYILGRTWALLRQESVLDLPGDIERLVQAVYGDACLPDDLDGQAREFIEVKAYGAYLGDQQTKTMLTQVAIHPDEQPQDAYTNRLRGYEAGEEDGLGLPNTTRLGDDGVVVVPVIASADGWHVEAGDVAFSPNVPASDVVAERLYARQVRLSRKGVVQHFLASPRPVAFEHPLLRNAWVMPLVDGRYLNGEVRIRLDPTLGVVYE